MTQGNKAGAGPSLSDFQRATAEYAFRRLYGDLRFDPTLSRG